MQRGRRRAHGTVVVIAVTSGDRAAEVRAAGPLVSRLMPLTRDDGRWVIAGAVAGAVVEFDLRRLYLHDISLIGSPMHTRKHFAALLRTARRGAVRPVIEARYAREDLAAAQERFGRQRHVGKIVVAVEGHQW
ncbi:zinc-binding dehydrogenase [Nocardiopsis halotolerans]|uniref:zinc-binding dehydrogenase n=1 Tax=Nocardiopsis halotolerans TaxID=124252 RepID=UPI000348E290|nr:zinc-binding dehydrogenase [Nocardiopsis halotolerans]